MFEHILSTLPSITIDGISTEIINGYPVRYPICYINDTISHKILCIAIDSGVGYPCVMSYGKVDNTVSMLLRWEFGRITLINCIVPFEVGQKSKEIIAIDLKNNKILFENHKDWIEMVTYP